MLPGLETQQGDNRRPVPSQTAAPGRRLRVAVDDEELCYPLNSGKRIRTLNLLLPLARRHDITCLAYRGADPAETRDATKFLAAEGIRPVLVDRVLPAKSGPVFYARLLLNLFSRNP